MKKSMFVAIVMGFMFSISTAFAAPGCCSVQQKKSTPTQAVKKAAISCPKLQGMTAAEKKAMMAKCQKMIQTCPKLKGMNKAEMQQAMKKCPKLKDMSDANKKVKLQTTCPVMGGKINKKLYVDVNGNRIYICCAGCIAAIKKDPAKYISKLEKAGITIEKVKPAKAVVKK